MHAYNVFIVFGLYLQLIVTLTASKDSSENKPRVSTKCNCGILTDFSFRTSLQQLQKHIDQKIVNGRTIKANRHPYLALLMKKSHSSKKFTHACGGTIINNKYVLTAAHCFGGSKREVLRARLSDWLVRLGVHSKLNLFEGVSYSITSLIIHKKYKPVGDGGGLDNDIALLLLNATISYTSKIHTACLPTMDTSEYETGIVQGWGKTETGRSSLFPRKAKLRLLSDSDCRTSNIGPTMGEPDTKICAEDSTSDACQGDSGGPLFIQEKNTTKDVIIGIVSSGKGCGDFYYPGVYTKVEKYLSWIYSHTQDATYCS